VDETKCDRVLGPITNCAIVANTSGDLAIFPIISPGLQSNANYITPRDMLGGHQQEIFAQRDRKL